VEGQRLAAVVAGVELGAVGVEGAAVVDVDFVAWGKVLSVCLYASWRMFLSEGWLFWRGWRLLTALGLPGALDGFGDLDVEGLVERGGGAEEERER
jgi:hypothetical protein